MTAIVKPPPSTILEPLTSPIRPPQMKTLSISNDLNYQNTKLQERIDKCQPRSRIDLGELQLTDQDMWIVVKKAMVGKRCPFLHIRENYEITAEGAWIIAEALRENTVRVIVFSSVSFRSLLFNIDTHYADFSYESNRRQRGTISG